jgi:hypothetical protein
VNLIAESEGTNGANDPKSQQALANKLCCMVTAKTDLVSSGPDVDFVCDFLEEMFAEILAEDEPPPDWITIAPNSPGVELPSEDTPPPPPPNKGNKGK